MGFSVNELNLLGTLGRDAETRFTTNDVSVTNFSIATEHSYKDKNGDWKNTTTWHNVVAFNLSDFIKDELLKGYRVRLQGRVSNTSYDDKDGNKKYKSEVIADSRSIINLGRRQSSDSEATPQTESASSPQVENDDDLPF